jgi:CRP-like cAMP-binding protein
MSSTELTFKLIKQSKCPSYEIGDECKLSGNALLLKLDGENTFISTAIVRFPNSKKSCRTLIGDLTKLLIQYENIDRIPTLEVDCSGCSGSARLQYKKDKDKVTYRATFEKSHSENIEIAASLLRNFSIFRYLDENDLRDIISLLKLKKYSPGAIIIKKGDPAQNFHIILSGAVDVLDENGVRLSTLRKGDVFGEMSLISGDAVGATIKVAQTSTIVFIEGQDFKEVLNKFSSVQNYLTRILAKRLAESNVIRAEEIASGMTGQLSDLSVFELLQALNLSQKTGVLTLTLSKGSAKLYLRQGNLIKAAFNNIEGRQAIYEALKEKEGRFKFNPSLPDELKNASIIGSMMEMLLDTSRLIDEENTELEISDRREI